MNQEAIEPQDELEEVLNETIENEEPETPEEGATEDNAAPEEKKRNRVPAHRRINQMRRQLGDEERKNQDLTKRLEALENNNPKPKALVRPNEDNFENNADFHAALDGYHKADKELYAEEVATKREAKRRQEDEDYKIEESNRKNKDAWAKKTAAAHKADPEYKQKESDLVEDINHLKANNLFEEIFACDNGAKIVSSLSEDYSELERLSKLSPRAAAKAIWKLDNDFTKRQKQEEPLPPPTRDRNSRRSVPRGSNKPETQQEYNKRMNGL